MASFPIEAVAMTQRDLCHIFVSNMSRTAMFMVGTSTRPYVGPTKFQATLVNSLGRRVGSAKFELTADYSELRSNVNFDANYRVASTVLNDTVVPGLVLFISDRCFIVLTNGLGAIGTPPPGFNGIDVLESMAAGDACVFALTTKGLFEGRVSPATTIAL
jgi:hypothetical protein